LFSSLFEVKMILPETGMKGKTYGTVSEHPGSLLRDRKYREPG
jgi:hypothetical protein